MQRMSKQLYLNCKKSFKSFEQETQLNVYKLLNQEIRFKNELKATKLHCEDF